jgi:hypothetical protein
MATLTKSPAAARTMRIWADTIRLDRCGRCGRLVYFAQNIRTGNFNLFDVRPAAVLEESELGTGRPLWVIDLAATVVHFVSCTGSRPRRRRRGRR